jgi:hypothetical protein
MESIDCCALTRFKEFCRRINSTSDKSALLQELGAIGKAIAGNMALQDRTHLFDLAGKESIISNRLRDLS